MKLYTIMKIMQPRHRMKCVFYGILKMKRAYIHKYHKANFKTQ